MQEQTKAALKRVALYNVVKIGLLLGIRAAMRSHLRAQGQLK